MIRIAMIVLALAGFLPYVHGQNDRNPERWCRGGFFTRESESFRIATVRAPRGERSYFYKDEPSECPYGRACRGRSYLVDGDRLVVSKTYRGFACGWYINRQGRETVGWIRTADLRIDDADASPALVKWLGEWLYAENSIRLSNNETAELLEISGDALWKGLGGNVHIGELEGRSKPVRNLLEYSDGDDEYDCKATMRLIGDFLVVADNMKCGGVNVTFSGIYKRAETPKKSK